VLSLACREPIDAITASAVCTEAGITRDTFYRYSTSPTQLLADALGEEIDALMAALPVDVEIGAAEHRLLEHVSQRADVYKGAMRPKLAAPVRDVLEGHLREGLLNFSERFPGILPPGLDGDASGQRMAVAYAASGTVGAIEQWLADSNNSSETDALDIDRGVEVILLASPAWWLRR